MQRVEEYDLTKGFAVILVIYGHIRICPEFLLDIIYAFHMPLFFLIAGLLLKNRGGNSGGLKRFAKNKAIHLLVPALLLEFLNYAGVIIKELLLGSFSVEMIAKRFAGIFLQMGIEDFRGSLWFLPTIFLCFLIAYWIIRMRKIWAILVTVLLYILGYIFCHCLTSVYLPWHLEVVPAGLSYVIIGYYLKDIYPLLRKRRAILIPIFAVVSAGLYYYCYCVCDYVYAMSHHLLGHILLTPVVAVLMSLTVLLIFSCVADVKEIKWLTYMGKNSLTYYGVQQSVVSALAIFTPKLLSVIPVSANVLSFPILLLATLGSTLLVLIWNKLIASHLQ